MADAGFNGLTLGYAPRLKAAVDSLFSSDPNAYTNEKNSLDAHMADIWAQHPYLEPAAEAVGGLALPFGAFGGAAEGAGLAARAIQGMGAGAVIGGVQGASQSPDLTDIRTTARLAAHGAETGGAFGAGLPVAGSIGAGLYRAAAPFGAATAPGLNRVATGLVSSIAKPETLDRLGQLGPHGMIADTSPAALGLAQGIGAKGGAPANTVVNALSNRAAGQSDRLLSSLDENLGSAISPREVAAMMKAREAATSPVYEGALRNAPLRVDISGVQRQLDTEMLSAKGKTMGTPLKEFQDLLQNPYPINGVRGPEYEARALHNAKQAMDVIIAQVAKRSDSAAISATGGLSRVRAALNDALQQQVKGYADANLAFKTAKRGAEAFDAGRQALKPGAETLWPRDLEHEFAALPIEQQALYRSGARSEIAAGLGTNPNDLGALNKVLGGENDFNRPKMGTLFGSEQAGNVVRDVGSERTFANTNTAVAGGAQTAQRVGNAAAIEAAQPQYFIPRGATPYGMLGHAGEYVTRKMLGALAANSGNNTRQQIADFLISGGPAARENTQAVINALLGHRTVADMISGVGGSQNATAAALLAYQGIRR